MREMPVGTEPGELTQRQIWIILGSLVLGTVLAALDGTIVSTALPTIAGKLGGFSSYAWVGTAYILTSTIATPIIGKLGDLYGRRTVILSTITIFLIGSLLCGLARNMGELIAFRGLQGIGGGGIQALTFAILGDLVSPRERGRYMGMYTGVYAASAVIGPLVGGWMIDHFAWQWIFLFNVPIAAIAFIAISSTLKVTFRRRAVRIDGLGAVLLSASLGSLVLGLDRGRHGWFRGPVMLLFGLSIVTMIVFLTHEARAAEPIIPMRLFKNPVFAIASSMGFCVGSLTYGAQQFLPIQFQDANFVSPTTAGLYLTPLMAGVMLGSTFGGRLIAQTGRYKRVPITGLALTVSGIAVLSRMSSSWSFLTLVLPMLGIGIGTGATFTTTSIAMQNAIDPLDIGTGTAAMLSIRSLGGSLGLAVFGTLFNARVAHGLAQHIAIADLPAGVTLNTIVREPAKIRALAEPVRSGVVQAITSGTGRVFLFAVPVALIAFVLANLIPELPLRTTRGVTAVAPPE